MSQVKRHNPLQLAGDGLDPASANFDVSMYEVLKSWGASEAAVALPLPPMRRIRFEPVLSPLRVEALAAVSQVKLTELHLEPTRAFWEADGLGSSTRSPAATGWAGGPARCSAGVG